MELQELVQEYVNLLSIYEFCQKYPDKIETNINNIEFLGQKKNIAHKNFINQVFLSNYEDLVELNEFLKGKINEINKIIDNLAKEKIMLYNRILSRCSNEFSLYTACNERIKQYQLEKEKYENISYGLTNILGNDKNKTYTK